MPDAADLHRRRDQIGVEHLQLDRELSERKSLLELGKERLTKGIKEWEAGQKTLEESFQTEKQKRAEAVGALQSEYEQQKQRGQQKKVELDQAAQKLIADHESEEQRIKNAKTKLENEKADIEKQLKAMEEEKAKD